MKLTTQFSIASLLVAGLLAHPVAADTPNEPAARAHFKQGKAFLDAGVYDEAITEFRTAYEIVPLPELLFNIGQAYRLKGDAAQAKDAYRKYLAVVTDGPLADEARVHVAQLTKQLSTNDEATKKRQADEAAARSAAESSRKAAEAEALQKVALDTKRTTWERERADAHDRHATGKIVAVIGGGLMVVGGGIGALAGANVADFFAGMVAMGLLGGGGAVTLVVGLAKMSANSDPGPYVVPVVTSTTTGAAIGWTF